MENKKQIENLSEKSKYLEDECSKLKSELEETKSINDILKVENEKIKIENRKIESLSDFRDHVIDLLEDHVTEYECPPNINASYDEKAIYYSAEYLIDSFYDNKSEYTNAKLHILTRDEYTEYMNSKEELEEYRIYKRVKAKMSSHGKH